MIPWFDQLAETPVTYRDAFIGRNPLGRRSLSHQRRRVIKAGKFWGFSGDTVPNIACDYSVARDGEKLVFTVVGQSMSDNGRCLAASEINKNLVLKKRLPLFFALVFDPS